MAKGLIHFLPKNIKGRDEVARIFRKFAEEEKEPWLMKEYAYYPGLLAGRHGGRLRYVDQARHEKLGRYACRARRTGAAAARPRPTRWTTSSPRALAARNLAIVERMGAATLRRPAPPAFPHSRRRNRRWQGTRHSEDEVNGLLDAPYNCTVTAKSALQVIYEDIGLEEVARPVDHALPDLRMPLITAAYSTGRRRSPASTTRKTPSRWTGS